MNLDFSKCNRGKFYYQYEKSTFGPIEIEGDKLIVRRDNMNLSFAKTADGLRCAINDAIRTNDCGNAQIIDQMYPGYILYQE